jgi:hypothetical protein
MKVELGGDPPVAGGAAGSSTAGVTPPGPSAPCTDDAADIAELQKVLCSAAADHDGEAIDLLSPNFCGDPSDLLEVQKVLWAAARDVHQSEIDLTTGDEDDAEAPQGVGLLLLEFATGVTKQRPWRDVCLISALRSLGVPLQYCRDGPFSISQVQGMIAPLGYSLESVPYHPSVGVPPGNYVATFRPVGSAMGHAVGLVVATPTAGWIFDDGIVRKWFGSLHFCRVVGDIPADACSYWRVVGKPSQ